jgi:putative hydrolase of HD superfamily
MVLVHDLVEIDAGDTFVYDQQNNKTKALREQKAADRIFSILPDDQRDTFRELWDEFEERKTPEAKFAAAIDRFEPILQNYLTKGYAWQEHNITKDMVLNTNKKIADGSKILWEHVKSMIDDSVKQGFLQD